MSYLRHKKGQHTIYLDLAALWYMHVIDNAKNCVTPRHRTPLTYIWHGSQRPQLPLPVFVNPVSFLKTGHYGAISYVIIWKPDDGGGWEICCLFPNVMGLLFTDEAFVSVRPLGEGEMR